MNKKLLVSTIALLALFMMIISPVKAITKADYWANIQFNVFDDPDKQWPADGIIHMKDMHWSGSYVGILGIGTFDVWFEHLCINVETGEGTYRATWLITITEEDTLAGNARGKITGAFAGVGGFASGTFAGAHGTGAFEGYRKMGPYELDLTAYTMVAEGTIIYP